MAELVCQGETSAPARHRPIDHRDSDVADSRVCAVRCLLQLEDERMEAHLFDGGPEVEQGSVGNGDITANLCRQSLSLVEALQRAGPPWFGIEQAPQLDDQLDVTRRTLEELVEGGRGWRLDQSLTSAHNCGRRLSNEPLFSTGCVEACASRRATLRG